MTSSSSDSLSYSELSQNPQGEAGGGVGVFTFLGRPRFFFFSDFLAELELELQLEQSPPLGEVTLAFLGDVPS